MRLAILFLVLQACSYCEPDKLSESRQHVVIDPYLDSLLSKAVEDTKIAELNEQVNTLLDPREYIVEYKNKEYVKGVTWINKYSEPYWFKALESSDSTILVDGYIWLTIVPELKDFCTAEVFRSKEHLVLRLKQRMGFDYKTDYSYLVEVLVPLSKLKRPCMNPDIRNSECLAVATINMDSEYSQWFLNQRSELKKDGAIPFTGLGYTYDWGSADSEVGFSEFVIIGDGNISLIIKGIYSPEEYCIKTKS